MPAKVVVSTQGLPMTGEEICRYFWAGATRQSRRSAFESHSITFI